MDKTIVGNNAGKVWYALKEIGEISIPELARRLNLSVESTALAAGWLARENKTCYYPKLKGKALSSDKAINPFFRWIQILVFHFAKVLVKKRNDLSDIAEMSTFYFLSMVALYLF